MTASTIQFTTFEANRNQRRGVLAYIRVSSEEQADRKNSLEEQKRRIRQHFEGQLGLTILEWYADEGASAFKDDEKRESFWRMIQRAKDDERVGIVAVDEESRFFRNKYKSASVKGELLEHGVTVQTVSRTTDPRTITGMWQEAIEETMAQAHSMQNREYTLRGMAGNIRQRDPETGWAFKNGGKAPYGWKAKRIDMGRDAKGRPLARTIWLLDEDKAAVRRNILLARMEGLTYVQIRDRLNDAGIPSPGGGLWGESTIVRMLEEDNVWTAAGYSIWNKHYRKRKPKGIDRKPTSEWVIEPNGHPAIISEEEARAILKVNSKRRKMWAQGDRKSQSSPALIRGDNLDGHPLFICSACGKRMLPLNPGRGKSRKYVCSTKEYKGARFCPTKRIDAEHLEKALIDLLRSRFTEGNIRAIIDAANRMIKEEMERDRPNVDHRKSRLKEIDQQVDRIQRSILAGVDPDMWVDKLNALKEEKEKLEEALRSEPTNEETPRYQIISPKEADRIVAEFASALASPSVPERRRVVQSLVRQITLSHQQQAIYVELQPNPLELDLPTHFVMPDVGNKLAPPRGYVLITYD